MKFYLFFLKILSLSHLMFSTIDLTLPEFQYLANHLTKDECHKLIASLHFASFDLNQINQNVESAENAIPEDISCLRLLLHWNSSPNEGRGITHEKVSLRLRQMGKHELADWLDKAVLEELEGEIVETAEEFKNKETSEETRIDLEEDYEEQLIMDFNMIDIVMVTTAIVCILAICIAIFVLGYRIYRRYKQNKIDTKKIVEERYKDRMRKSKVFNSLSILQHSNVDDKGYSKFEQNRPTLL